MKEESEAGGGGERGNDSAVSEKQRSAAGRAEPTLSDDRELTAQGHILLTGVRGLVISRVIRMIEGRGKLREIPIVPRPR
ncbi:hypothetical protein EYF80_016059 [Liparis tanakae]|uniref:Uncharacterized protein n=1 Tax=Liparis tanakae TaxID=230148 RepID=A0A4Z2I6J5_9TELE|nr:hypothetical protein EYF80_016059 [Liparis tanakae]